MAWGLGDGRKVVTAAGTAEALTSSTQTVQGLIITAETDNTDYIVVGGSGVVEADATRTGVPLAAGDSHTLYDVDLADIYIDAAVNGEGVTYFFWW